MLADARRSRILHANPSDLSSPIEVDMWVRYTLADALFAVLQVRERRMVAWFGVLLHRCAIHALVRSAGAAVEH